MSNNIECCGLCNASIVVELLTPYTEECFPACRACVFGYTLAHLATYQSVFTVYKPSDLHHVYDSLGNRLGDVTDIVCELGVVTGTVTDVLGQHWSLRFIVGFGHNRASIVKRRSL